MPQYIGREIGGIRILEKIGEGGMAKVYKAYQSAFDRVLALKILPDYYSSDEKYIQRFQQEARVIASLEHRHILPVYAVGEETGTAYLAMRYIKAGTLKDVLVRAPDNQLPIADTALVIYQIAQALDHAHRRNIIHRDVKPSNVLMDMDGYAYLMDFGIAKILEGTTELTATGAALGTPAYMSPEQGLGKAVDGRSDIYSLGVMLYEMLTGRKPYRADTPMAVMLAHVHEPLPLPRFINPDIPEEIERVILKALAKDPSDRFQTAGEFGAALKKTVLSLGIMFEEETYSSSLQELCVEVSEGKPSDDLTVDEISLIQQKQKKNKHAKGISVGWVISIFAVVMIMVAGLYFGANIFRDQQQINVNLLPTGVSELILTEGSDLDVAVLPTYTPLPTYTSLPTFTIGATVIETALPTATVFVTSTPVGISAGEVRANKTDNAPIVFIPSAEFTMGLMEDQVALLSSKAQDCIGSIESSTPAHQVYIDAYWIYQTEVTNGMYRQCVQAGKCDPPAKFNSVYRSNYYGNSQYDEYPVVMVSWEDANTYCQWAGGRLPTSAEWEYAARGNDGRLFPWGNELPTVYLANFDLKVGDTEPVTDWPEGISPFGLYHMAGNVFEWVGDWYSSRYYQTSPYANPTGPANESNELSRRALRGGSWEWDLGCASSGVQDYWEEAESGLGVGFRCVVPYQP
ncbi:SUMF1/EgtB/PvdO family nonheme iron enzyme [bacterium]|nr:SUMF1/EgtB/PvdO family nonheme iron enzyme [bacterium]